MRWADTFEMSKDVYVVLAPPTTWITRIRGIIEGDTVSIINKSVVNDLSDRREKNIVRTD